ncbi:MAG: hypothetical protein MHM6MM_003651 [Cercozoa sp. M6MM]
MAPTTTSVRIADLLRDQHAALRQIRELAAHVGADTRRCEDDAADSAMQVGVRCFPDRLGVSELLVNEYELLTGNHGVLTEDRIGFQCAAPDVVRVVSPSADGADYDVLEMSAGGAKTGSSPVSAFVVNALPLEERRDDDDFYREIMEMRLPVGTWKDKTVLAIGRSAVAPWLLYVFVVRARSAAARARVAPSFFYVRTRSRRRHVDWDLQHVSTRQRKRGHIHALLFDRYSSAQADCVVTPVCMQQVRVSWLLGVSALVRVMFLRFRVMPRESQITNEMKAADEADASARDVLSEVPKARNVRTWRRPVRGHDRVRRSRTQFRGRRSSRADARTTWRSARYDIAD